MALRESHAEVVIACAPEAAFAWLADPRNADQWFASVALAEPPERPLRAGGAWRFSMLRQHGRVVPMRLAAYHAPQSFTWETTYPAWRDNLQWALDLAPAPADEEVGAMPRTRLRLTIRQRPGPLGWPALALAALLGRIGAVEGASMAARAERAAERAREALEATPTLSYGPRPRRPSSPRGKSQRQTGRQTGRQMGKRERR